MSTRFPVANLPTPMSPWQRALENTLTIAENAQTNTDDVLSGMRQSVASNYGLGSRLTTNAGSLSGKVATDLQNMQGSPASAVTLQRSWTNLDGTISITTPPFAANIALAVAGTAFLDVSGGSAGATYSQWQRINISGALTANKTVARTNFGQVLFAWQNVPASSALTVRMQVWGFIENPDLTYVNGSISTLSVVRLATSLRAIALV